MKMQTVSRTLIATMVAISLAGSGSAWADRENKHRSYSHSQGGQHDKHAYGKRHGSRIEKRAYSRRHEGRHDKHYAYNKHKRHHYRDSYKSKHYGKHHRKHRGNKYYYYEDDDNHDDVLIGLLVGGLIGYALNSSQDDNYAYDSYPQSHTQRNAQTATYEGVSNSSCLQEREYQTKVIVGGRTVDAYGSACLQPDGSWKRSPAELASF